MKRKPARGSKRESREGRKVCSEQENEGSVKGNAEGLDEGNDV